MQPPGTPLFVTPDDASTTVFVLIVLFVAVSLVAGIARTSERSVLTVLVSAPLAALWLGGTAALSASGVLARGDFAVGLLVGPSLLAAVVLPLTGVGARLAKLPVAALVGFQAFRLPLEILLHHWYEGGTVPVQISWSGDNGDVVTGVLATILLLWGLRWELPPWVVWGFQLVGFGLLLNVLRVALTSAPTPFLAYATPILLPFHVPFGWIVSVCVAGALAGHLVLFRWLFTRRGGPAEG